jgi:bacillolysin
VVVMGGELVVQLSDEGEVISAAGEVLPSSARATTQAAVGPIQARNAAARWVARETGRTDSVVTATAEGLGLYDPRLMDDPALADLSTRLVWRIGTRAPASATRQADQRLVIVDARGGQVLTSIGRIATAEGPNRRVCDNKNVPGRSWSCNGPLARVEGQAWTGVSDVDAAYRLMGVTYDYFLQHFGRDGIDGKGSRMKATVRYCPSSGCPWRNAEWRWGPQQATFGRGWAKADDIVAHEYTHGVLDAEAPLFYHYQSGAINESYADVFGELIDLSYAGGKDASWARWKIGEDTPIGVFRDMRQPARHGHPDRVRSPKWHTGASDYGGVHRNNGVGNKAAYLMAAGGNFNGYAIKAIGQDRTALVWYRALTTRLTPAANYVDLADALVSACTDLAGSNGLTLVHCKSMRDATRATQMNLKPKLLAPATAPICGPAVTAYDVFRDDLEAPGSGAWVTAKSVGSKKGWYWPQNPNNVVGWDGTWASSGKHNFYAPNRGTRSDSWMRMTETVVLPEHAFLRFGHGYSFDKDRKHRYDGGLVEIRVNDGPWRSVAGLFTHGKYNGTIAKGYGNPLAGKRAFTGNSRGWAKARIDLSRFAGSRLNVRFRIGSDRKVGARGWYIDDVRIYSCASDTDKPTGALTIDGGAETTTDGAVTLGLTWDDATTWVSKVRLSGSPRLNDGGTLLLKGITMAPRATVPWDLDDLTFGGSGAPGPSRVYAQVRDAAGNWSAVFSDEIERLP